jgi:hypothetical protein
MRLLILLLLVGATAAFARAQSAPPADPRVRLEVSVADNRREFRIGELIPLRLSFSSRVKDRYQVNAAQYDRGGRMNYEHFIVAPADGAVDPLPSNTGGMGGITSFKFLTTEPWTITLDLNEWVRFTRRGEYKLTVSSSRVGVRDPASPLGASPVTAVSGEITLKIIAADRAWQKEVYGAAVAALDAPAPTKSQQTEQYRASRRRALDVLRFLGTAEAARELAKRMRGEDMGLDYVCMLGLISSPERAAARSALEEALADPDHPIDAGFLNTLREVQSEPGAANADWREGQRKVVEELLGVLPRKRGKALSVSLNTAVNEAWNGDALPQQTTEELAGRLVAMFDQLPVEVQNSLLTYRWDKIGGPAMLPVLRRYAEGYQDFPEMRESHAYTSLQLSASALRHWYELDPAGARPAVIKEIIRPRPRYGARALGFLPDETLPEVDLALAEHLRASDDSDGSSNLASLVARYATAAILPQVMDELDAHIGKWACAVQDPLLAYVLRVNPALARPRIEQAVAARGEDFTACNHELFQGVSEIRYDPVLEEIGIHSLDDPDPQVAMTAATMLGRFGSPAAEEALWRRYESWAAQWAGREAELDVAFGERTDDRTYQLGLGENLVQALATGRSWMTDRAKLQRLAGLSGVRRLHQQLLDNYLKLWDEQPLTIRLDSASPPAVFHARVAQYEFQSLDALKEKLSQFPAGTKFFLSPPPVGSPAGERTLTELRAFLSDHGMSAAGEKQAN